MKGVVVDASAALTLLHREPGHETVRMHLARRIAEGRSRIVPPIFWLEVVNVLAKRYRYSPAAIVEAVYELEQVGLTTTEVGRPETLAVIDTVGRSGLTAYDAAYLVLAEAADAMLLTADSVLAAAAGERGVLVIPADGITDDQPPYRVVPPWPAWKGAVAYLSELRSGLI